jgi:glycosyltransferase involved in cell wall biosynthesis
MLSIIIPNYNKVLYLKESLQSVITQKYTDWEAIVVDDGSTDGSQNLLKEIAETDDRIRFFQRESSLKGGSVCRNIGIEQANGEYLMFFDSDDLMAPDCLQQRMDYIINYPYLHFIVFPIGTFYKAIGDRKIVWQTSKSKNYLKAFLQHDLPWHTMSPIWKTTFIKEQMKGFDELFPRLQDVEFHTRALLEPNVKYSIVNDVEPKCFYRVDDFRTNQSYIQKLKIMLLGIKMYIEKYEKIITEKDIKKNLRGTLFAFLIQTNYYRAISRINKQEYQLITNQVNDEIMKASELFTPSKRKFLDIYNFMYQKGFWHIKGFNFLAKILFVKV